MSEFTKSAFDPAAAFETDRSDFYADDTIWAHEFDDVNGVSDLYRLTGLEPTVVTLMKDDPEMDKFRQPCCGGHFRHHTSRCRKFG